MKRFQKIFRCVAAVAAAIMLLPGVLPAAELTQGEKDTIYIGDLKVQPAVVESASTRGFSPELRKAIQSLDTQLITALNATRVFQLVERKRKSDLELEQDFAAVAVDPDDRNAAQAGKMAGARFAFLPQIDGFEDRSETTEHQATGRASLERSVFLSAVVQVVETTSGRVLSESPSVQLTRTESLENVRPAQAVGSDQLLVTLAKDAAQKLSQELTALLRPAKVLSVTGSQIMINRGSDAGFGKGDLVEVYATQDVKDEDSGEIFRNEVAVGQAKIVRLDKKQSFATIFGENLGVAKGCVVRISKGAATPQAEGKVSGEDNGEVTPGSSEKPLNWK